MSLNWKVSQRHGQGTLTYADGNKCVRWIHWWQIRLPRNLRPMPMVQIRRWIQGWQMLTWQGSLSLCRWEQIFLLISQNGNTHGHCTYSYPDGVKYVGGSPWEWQKARTRQFCSCRSVRTSPVGDIRRTGILDWLFWHLYLCQKWEQIRRWIQG